VLLVYIDAYYFLLCKFMSLHENLIPAQNTVDFSESFAENFLD